MKLKKGMQIIYRLTETHVGIITKLTKDRIYIKDVNSPEYYDWNISIHKIHFKDYDIKEC